MSASTAPAPVDLGEHTGLLYAVARQFVKKDPYLEVDELANVGLIGLAQAVQKHDPARGKFSGYAWAYIDGEIRNHLRRERRRAMQPLPEGVDRHALEPEARPEPEPGTADDVRQLLRCLTGMEKKVVRLFYGLGGEEEMGAESIAASLGVSVRYVHKILDGAISRMKKRAGSGRTWPAP
jgi:RNA polymerase sigma factor (sigma-70 family)